MRPRRWWAALSLCVVAGSAFYPSPAGATTASAPTIEPRLVTRSPQRGWDVIVSVPPTLRGATLTSGDFGVRARGSTVPASVTRMAGTGLQVIVIIDPYGSTDGLASMQGAAVELLLGLPPSASITMVTPGGTTSAGLDRRAALGAVQALTPTPAPTIATMLDAAVASPVPSGGRRVVIAMSAPTSPSQPDPTAVTQLGGPLESIEFGSPIVADTAMATLATVTGGRVQSSATPADLLAAVDQTNSEIASLYTLHVTAPPSVHSIDVSVNASAGAANATIALTPTSPGSPSDAPATARTPAQGTLANDAAPPATVPAPVDETGGRGLRSWNFVALVALVAAGAALAVRALTTRRRNRWDAPVDVMPDETKARVMAAQSSLERLALQRRDSPVRIPERLLVALEATAGAALDAPGNHRSDQLPDPLAALTTHGQVIGEQPVSDRIGALTAGLLPDTDRDAAAEIAAHLPHRHRLGEQRDVEPSAHTLLAAARQAARVSRAHRFGSQSDQVGRSLLATWPAREGLLDHVPTLVSRSLVAAGVTTPERLDFDDHVSVLVSAVGDAADRTLRAELELSHLQQSYLARLEVGGHHQAGPIVTMLLTDPIVTVQSASTALGMAEGDAAAVIADLTDAGWLVRVALADLSVGPEWAAVDVISTVTAAFDSADNLPSEEFDHVSY